MLERYFTDERIINQLCKERVKLAGQRHDRQYINRMVGHVTEAAPGHPFYQLLPPRRRWSAFRPRIRTDGLNPDLHALKNAVRILRYQQPEQRWAVELNRYINAIRDRVFNSPSFTISPPTVHWELKGKGEHEYRAICQFSPDDNLILCLYAHYLRDAFDSQFSPSSYAFRAARNGQIPAHHDAFTDIYNLKHDSRNHNFYVAECDIKGFFDTVDHAVALRAFREAGGQTQVHSRAESIFMAYLNCYSFPANVLAEAEPRLKQHDPNGYFKWPEADLRRLHGAEPRRLRIGVAQGGAVSGIIANLIMDPADKLVEAKHAELGAEIHYYRYCDDMLLILPNLKYCEQVFNAYLNKLTELKLTYHRPEKTIQYGMEHWGHKSKAPYRWTGRRWFGCVPWIQFVGYQIRYDGLARPRKDSVKKQCIKLVETTNKLKFGLIAASRTHQVQANRGQAVASLTSKLVAQGVGRIKGFVAGPKPMCWAWGYKALHNKAIVDVGLRAFDRARRKQIRRFNAAIIQYGLGNNAQTNNRRNPIGYTFSYHAQFTNRGGGNLIHNPWKPINLKQRIQCWVYNKPRSSIIFRTALWLYTIGLLQ